MECVKPSRNFKKEKKIQGGNKVCVRFMSFAIPSWERTGQGL